LTVAVLLFELKLTLVPLQSKLEISSVEAVEGCTINFNTYVSCETCNMYMHLYLPTAFVCKQ
jgi:hypothetical protein